MTSPIPLYIARLKQARDAIPQFRKQKPDTTSSEFRQWKEGVTQTLQGIGGPSDYVMRFLRLRFHGFTPRRTQFGVTGTPEGEAWRKSFDQALIILNEAIEEAELTLSASTAPAPKADAVTTVERLAIRLPIVAKQLERRHGGRPTLVIADEYDVQDLLHALLRLFFDDVRDEEWTPSYAGGSSRLDFLLKAEKVVVECKMTRAGLKDRQLGDELLVDIGRYQSHQDCKTLICIVYDPCSTDQESARSRARP